MAGEGNENNEGTGASHGNGQTQETVSYRRFAQVNERRANAETRVAELEGQINDYEAKAGSYATLAEQFEAAKSTHEAERASWQRELAMSRAGIIEDDDVVVADALYRRLPEEDRPDFKDWLGGFKADPATAPRSLSHIFHTGDAAPPPPPPPRNEDKPPPRHRAKLPNKVKEQTGPKPDWSKLSPEEKAAELRRNYRGHRDSTLDHFRRGR